MTASQFSAEVIAVAKGLIAAGIEPGDRVALMSHTRYEWTLIDYAIWTAGAVTVPVYETSSAEQAEWILSDSGAVRASSRRPPTRRLIEQRPRPAARRCRTSGGSTAALDSLRAAGATSATR